MKICYDNLERIYLSKKGHFRRILNNGKTSPMHYKESCRVCGEPYLSQYNDKGFCSKDCFNGSVYQKEKCSRKGNKNGRWMGGVYDKNIPLYDTYNKQINWLEKTKKDKNGWLMVKCTYCGKWFVPKKTDVVARIYNSNIKWNELKYYSEHRLYCSSNCKSECPIYRKRKHPKGFKSATSREVQAELRQLVLKRDNYTCVKCGETKFLHCHHIEGLNQNPIESADMDSCITVCKRCHMKIHKQEGCGYQDLKCSNNIEKEILLFLDENNIKYTYENNTIKTNKIYINVLKLDIHSDLKLKSKKYHLNKTIKCDNEEIQLLQVLDHEWKTKQDIVKSVILSKCGKYKQRIYARKCQIAEVSSKRKAYFLDENHLQGNCVSTTNIGLFYDNELISLMTFGKRNITGGNNRTELLRFCNKKHTQIIGGASKIFKYYINTYEPKKVISYADRRYSNGNMYYVLGFKLKHISKPNYWYFDKNKNGFYHRAKFQKHKLNKLLDVFDPNKTEWQNMQDNGYDRIWDCGNYVFEYK